VPEELRQVARKVEYTPAQLKAQGGSVHKDTTLSQRFAEL
jgi:hypothetical protein